MPSLEEQLFGPEQLAQFKRRTRQKPRPPTPGLSLADNELIASVLPELEGDPVGRLGADASAVTQLQDDTNIQASFTPAGFLPPEEVEQRIKGERSDLFRDDVIALRKRGDPKERPDVLAHEFTHRGISELQRQGLLPPDQPGVPLFQVDTSASLATNAEVFPVPEELFVRLLDIKTGRDTKAAQRFIKKEFKVTPALAKDLIDSPEFKQLLNATRQSQRRKIASGART